MTNNHFANFHIAGFTYYDGVDVFDELRVGTILQAVPEPDNPHDELAVALYYKDTKLGYIPRSCNQYISKLLNHGYTRLFDFKVNRVNPLSEPEGQVGVVVKIKKNK